MKVAELREALEARGLDTRGTKPFLVSRLEDAISKDAAEVEEKGRLKEMKETILAESSSAPPGATTAAPSTPGRRSRRLSGEYAALAAGGTPARRRLLDSVTGSPSRIGSPARKTRRISGGEERPSTPSRRSRRLSGCSADGDEEEVQPAPPTIPDPIEEVEEEEIEEQAESEIVKKIESEGGEVATELDDKKGEGNKLEITERDEKLEETEQDEKLEETELVKKGKGEKLEETEQDEKLEKTEPEKKDEGEKLEEEENSEEGKASSENSEKAETVAPEDTKDNVDESKKSGTQGEESNPEDEMEVEQVDEKVEIESEKSKTEETTSEGESEKENAPAKEVKSLEEVAVESTKDDSFSSAACAVIGSTNALISSLRQEMAARKCLVAPKQIPRQKPKSGKFWKEERSAFRSLKKDKGQRLTFDQRLAMKEEKVRNRDLAKTLLEQKNLKKEEMRKKIEENKAKKLENERKAEQFQVIKNPAKIKRMKKKQLRQLEKRDILAAK